MVFKNSFEAPKDFQQLRYLKCRSRAKKKDKPTATNIADEMLHVLEMVKDHPFVQKVEHTKNHIPSIILYGVKSKWLTFSISFRRLNPQEWE